MRLIACTRARGFTLIELMAVLALIGILAALAYPAYTSYVQRSRRADAAALLAAVVQAEERYRANHSSYASSLEDLGLGASASTRHYYVGITGYGDPTDLSFGYVVTAWTRPDSPQARDTTCTSLKIQVNGASMNYLASNSAGADTSSTCWPR